MKRLHRHHQWAAVLFAAVVVWDVAGALLFAVAEHRSGWTGLYWAETTVTTVGYGDVTPHSHAGHVIAALVMLSILPLGFVFGLLASGFMAGHVDAALNPTDSGEGAARDD